jgi:hypothetical protein
MPPNVNIRNDDDIDTLVWSMYTTPIGVGNPPLPLEAVVDTSWSTLFVPSVNCTDDLHEREYCITHPLYNSSHSSTYSPNLTSTSSWYTGGAGLYTYGKSSYDSFHVAGIEIKAHLFQEVLQWRPDYGTNEEFWDTALGLALFPTPNRDLYGTFTASSSFQHMIEQRLLEESSFTLQLPRRDDEIGVMSLGSLPAGVSRKDMIEVPLTAPIENGIDEDGLDFWDHYTMSGWSINIASMSMVSNYSMISIPIDGPRFAVVSSSFPWIAMTDEAALAANRAIGLEYVWDWLNCSKREELPDLEVKFGENKTIILTPWDYLIEEYHEYFQQLRCVSAFYGLGWVDKGYILLGAPFLNGLTAVFDANRGSISFGNRPRTP